MFVCVFVCGACVCLSLRGCLQAKLCRVYHYYFLMTVSDTVPNGNPVCATKPKHLYSMFACNHAAVCAFLQVCLCVCLWEVMVCVCVCALQSLCTICTVTNSWSVWECVGGILLQEHVRAIRVGLNYKHTHGCTSTHIWFTWAEMQLQHPCIFCTVRSHVTGIITLFKVKCK